MSTCLSFYDATTGETAMEDVDMIENPPVNPITGAHRSAKDVQVELRQHYAEVRRSSTIPPIFLADYLFFSVRGKGITLGRVTHTPHGGALRRADVVDITEYEHTPQPGFHGFFGTFKPLANPDYDPKLRGSTKTMRHRDVRREDVIIFNVRMTGRTSEDLRVSLTSLRELAHAIPDLHKLPQKLPPTHKAQRAHTQQKASSSQPLPPTTSEPRRPPLVATGDRIEVYWEEDPTGWFAGKVTSHRRENDTWVTRVQYEPCDQWARTHSAWHMLDPNDDDHVTWRFARNTE